MTIVQKLQLLDTVAIGQLQVEHDRVWWRIAHQSLKVVLVLHRVHGPATPDADARKELRDRFIIIQYNELHIRSRLLICSTGELRGCKQKPRFVSQKQIRSSLQQR